MPSDVSYRFRCFDDARAYAERVRPFLLREEAVNNVLLGVLRHLLTGDHDFDLPMLLASVEDDTSVAGCVWRTPPYVLGMTEMPGEAISSAADCVELVYPTIGAALGPPEVVTGFAKTWSARKSVRFSPRMLQGVYQLTRVVQPKRISSGKMVAAEQADLPIVVEWGRGFRTDSGVVGVAPEVLGKRLVETRRMFLWVDDGLRSMAAVAAHTDNGARIGYVYTPPEHRGRGYASALVAALSGKMLQEGRQYCFLFADLANPTSTGIYTMLGYRKVAESLHVVFEPTRLARA